MTEKTNESPKVRVSIVGTQTDTGVHWRVYCATCNVGIGDRLPANEENDALLDKTLEIHRELHLSKMSHH